MLFSPNGKRQLKSQGGGGLPHHSLVPENIYFHPTEGHRNSRELEGFERGKFQVNYPGVGEPKKKKQWKF